MPKRKSRSSRFDPRVLGLLAATALGLFLIGEAVRAFRSDAGRLALARTVGLGDRADLLRIVGKQLRLGLASAGVPRDSITETPLDRGAAPVRWRIGLRPTASLIQVNYALTRALEEHGAVVLDGSERWTDGGGQVVRLLVGLPRRPTHEVLIVRRRAGPDDTASDPARVALVLAGKPALAFRTRPAAGLIRRHGRHSTRSATRRRPAQVASTAGRPSVALSEEVDGRRALRPGAA